MTDIGEMVSPPGVHTDPNDECPFCPAAKQDDYTTFPGSTNDSGKLGDIMETPSKLASSQSGARPQTGKSNSDGFQIEQGEIQARVQDKTTWYTHQAHHLISGKQALDGSPIEDWLVGGSKIEKDTGYSVNSTGNGFWAPSVPKQYVGKWGAKQKVLTDAERQTQAEAVMKAAGAQAHIGPHNISDSDDPNGDIHESYDKYIKKKLVAISDRIQAWSGACGFCDEEKGKPQTTYRVNVIMDNMSGHLKTEITGARQSWRIFLSKYARDYHKPVCSHGEII